MKADRMIEILAEELRKSGKELYRFIALENLKDLIISKGNHNYCLTAMQRYADEQTATLRAEVEKAQSEIVDLKQWIFKDRCDQENAAWEDLEFLKSMKQRLLNAMDKNDYADREYAMNMIDDWITELEKKSKTP